MTGYPFSDIEKKWQAYWETHKTFRTIEDPSVPRDKRRYVLDMFPYPSSAGLHVGHPEGYFATDIYCRYLRMKGFTVLHPMGFDSFGLPAENYAIKTGTHPRVSTEQNIERFTTQMKSLGFSYDWDRRLSSCEPEYYRWTQWIFLRLWEKGLAYEAEAPINWCPSCLTGIANEEVKDGRCERCGTPVTRRNLRQWLLRITAFAERLLSDLGLLNWTESLKLMQTNWIGRSEGANVRFKLERGAGAQERGAGAQERGAGAQEGSGDSIEVYTTRPDTLFGATYMVLSPEHPLVQKITTPVQKRAVDEYVKAASMKSDMERTELAKDKTGVFTGAYALNPTNGKKIPVWISDYILISYGTGAIMAVPAHDERDFAFAKKFNLPIVQVVSKDGKLHDLAEADPIDGIAVNSGEFDGMTTAEFKKRIVEWLEKNGIGARAVNYKLRDWIFSRQRYWGEPIPLVHCPKDGTVAVPYDQLPLKLPEVKTVTRTGTGESPLAAIPEWVNTTCPKCGGPAKRETNTMPQWAGSCWYYLRFLDPANDKEFAARDKIDYWMPVDLYVGGVEHAVLHLLYARFWHKFLFDEGLVNSPEPFMRLVNQGMILGEGGVKMSKSLGNVINPDDIVRDFGADTMRVYEMFMGPLEVSKPWSTRGITGARRFLERIWRAAELPLTDDEPSEEMKRVLHKTIKKVSHDTDRLEFNTAIAQMMIFLNETSGLPAMPRTLWTPFVLLLSPYAPHLAEELWEKLGHKPSISREQWPSWIEELTAEELVEVVFQVNGKIRAKESLPSGTADSDLKERALANERIKEILAGKEIRKVIVVPNKLVNIVAALSGAGGGALSAEGAAIRARQARAAEWMKRNGLYAAVLEDFEHQRSASVRWLSGHPMDALLFLFASGATVLVPWDVNIARERGVVDRIVPYTEFKRSFKDAVRGVLRENGIEAAVGGPRARRKVEFPSRTSHLRFVELRDELPGADIEVRSDGFEYFVARERTVKDRWEVTAIEKAAEITNALIETIIDRVRADGDGGLREIDLAQLVEREALSLGAEGLGFETLAAGPGRSWAIHPFPSCSSGPFGGNGLSILDFGVKVDGYTSDVTLTFATGRMSAEQDRMIGLVEEAYHAAVSAVKKGASTQDPARKAEQVFSAAGQSMPHALGHGIGLDTHEAPLLRSQGENPDPALLPGMIITIEPGLYEPRHGGVRWENDVLVTDSAPRVLTRSRIVRLP